MQRENKLALSILMQCRNEENTVGVCVRDAKKFLMEHHIPGEVLVADNGSTDNSYQIARGAGARLIRVSKPGYGRTLRAGIKAARGRIIIMGDCDTTYDFRGIYEMYRLMADGKCDVVIGDRFSGGIEPGAMSLIHKIGVKGLSLLGRKRYNVKVADFHSGLRGLTKSAAETLHFRTTGMEFATEMIAEAGRRRLRIMNVPIKLKRCKYARKSKLRTVRDGLRHIVYIVWFRC